METEIRTDAEPVIPPLIMEVTKWFMPSEEYRSQILPTVCDLLFNAIRNQRICSECGE
jgi:hypothetical protein